MFGIIFMSYYFIQEKNKSIIFLYVLKAVEAFAYDNYVTDHPYNLTQETNDIDNILTENKVPQNFDYKIKETKDLNTENCTTSNYDYDYLVNEYFNEDKKVMVSNTNITYIDNEKATKSTNEEQTALYWETLRYLLYDIWKRRQNTIVTRLWKIIKVWILIYVAVAVPFWCTKGWCCCCLFCKFFKSTQTIEEAKKFLEANPPGVLQDNKGGVIFYEPTNNERECYEKFGHLIRTI